VEDTSESEAGCDDTVIHLANAGASDGSSSDTIKRKKQLRKRHDSLDEKKLHDLEPSECRTPTPGGGGGSQVQMQSQSAKYPKCNSIISWSSSSISSSSSNT